MEKTKLKNAVTNTVQHQSMTLIVDLCVAGDLRYENQEKLSYIRGNVSLRWGQHAEDYRTKPFFTAHNYQTLLSIALSS